MYALSEGAEWPEALRFATRLASTVVSRTSEDRYPELEEFIPMTEPDSGFCSTHANA
jgi:sugar/nucleoside kinase (ribokinase family)